MKCLICSKEAVDYFSDYCSTECYNIDVQEYAEREIELLEYVTEDFE